eukprot:CAMPEP_0118654142 /NCGR_PEP_ID=MMETSP0785-20121206/12223_1 /TAXON_ID=91992 /ORGANISM="Bolidomonas pacifica, Strain CCMP 1866" /LENGTH=231 /DNA_ID=CAMNT_0006546765 /DNA_START=26 /DNA_END=717 /DNA_ORIENTATION=+
MKLHVMKSLWGVPPPTPPETHFTKVSKYKSLGYTGFEVISFGYNDSDFMSAVGEVGGMSIIPQLHTSGGYISPQTNDYVYIGSLEVEDHVESLNKELAHLVDVQKEHPKTPIVAVNVHGGVDIWMDDPQKVKRWMENYASSVKAFKKQWETEFKAEIEVFTETHRQRVPYTPVGFKSSVLTNATEDVVFNADLSHWCVVSECCWDVSSSSSSSSFDVRGTWFKGVMDALKT